MGHINYQCLRGKVHARGAGGAADQTRHLWILLEANGEQWFATINVRVRQGRAGRAPRQVLPLLSGRCRLRAPVTSASILGAVPSGLSPVERVVRRRGDGFSARWSVRPDRYARPAHRRSGPRRPRPAPDAACCNSRRTRTATSSSTATPSPRTIRTRPTPPSVTHRRRLSASTTSTWPQGRPLEAINVRLHENGVWHDGACLCLGRARQAHERRSPCRSRARAGTPTTPAIRSMG